MSNVQPQILWRDGDDKHPIPDESVVIVTLPDQGQIHLQVVRGQLQVHAPGMKTLLASALNSNTWVVEAV